MKKHPPKKRKAVHAVVKLAKVLKVEPHELIAALPLEPKPPPSRQEAIYDRWDGALKRLADGPQRVVTEQPRPFDTPQPIVQAYVPSNWPPIEDEPHDPLAATHRFLWFVVAIVLALISYSVWERLHG